MPKSFFITTPIYYANAMPHIGHAYTTVAAETLARFKKIQGMNVFFSTGTDEHGMKIEKQAEANNKAPQVFTDEIAARFQDLWKRLNIEYTRFIRTTDPEHTQAVQRVLQRLYERGAVYKGAYAGRYCVGCEQFKTPADLIDGKCPDHGTMPELLEEETYLLKMTVWQSELIARIESDTLLIAPRKYKTEVLSFLRGASLQDVSISRKNVQWGIPLPFDEAHTTYVWLDAFLNYLTVLGWKGDPESVPEEWPADIHFIGKDILRVHATIWPVLLMHLQLPTPRVIFTHGHILSGGKKMSKTLKNTIAIEEMIKRFGTDGTRYLLLSAGAFGDDVDLTLERMTDKYNADLANGLGNLVARVLKLAEPLTGGAERPSGAVSETWGSLIETYQFSEALQQIWKKVAAANRFIDETKPWKVAKEDRTGFIALMQTLLADIAAIALELRPFLPATASKIEEALRTGQATALFPRL